MVGSNLNFFRIFITVPMWMLVQQMSHTWSPRDRTRTRWLAIVGYRADFRVDRLVSKHLKKSKEVEFTHYCSSVFEAQRTFVPLLSTHKFAFEAQRTFVALLPTHKIAQFDKRMGNILGV
jgi:hypothetical protein